jgi:AraC family transcriptional activator of pobA
MDARGNEWYKTCMKRRSSIPVFTLFGEHSGFPDVVHSERIHARAHLHDWVISPHRHDQMAQLFHIETGAARTQIDGHPSGLDAGDFLYIPQRIVHGFAFERGTEGLVLSFPWPVITALTPQPPALTQLLSHVVTGTASAPLGQLFAQVSAGFEATGTFRTQRLIGLSHAILAHVAEIGVQSQTSSTSSHKTLERFDALIARHLTDHWRPSDYAQALSITTGHLGRICRNATEKSASAYIEAAVMTEASRLLAFTRLSVSEIGYRLGYTDPPYFSRRFRMACGITPSAYRAGFLTDGQDAG